jgi:hypothetical protein
VPILVLTPVAVSFRTWSSPLYRTSAALSV